MNSTGLIIAGLVTFAVVKWAIVCAVVVARMHYLDKKTWHGRIVLYAWDRSWLPNKTCTYWLELFIAPFKLGIMFLVLGIVCGLVAVIRLIVHWFIAPLFFGKYVMWTYDDGIKIPRCKLPLREAVSCYLQGLVALPENGYEINGTIPLTNKTKPFMWLPIGWFIYTLLQHTGEIAHIQDGLASKISPDSAFYMIVLFVVAAIITLFPMKDIKDGWKILHGKVCREIPKKEDEEPTKAREEYECD